MAGAFFGALLVAAALFVVVPATPKALFFFTAAPVEKYGRIASMVFSKFEIPSQTFGVCAVMLAYAAVLFALYSIRLCSVSFNASALKWKTAVLGALLFPVMLPRRRDWRAFALAAASAAAAAMALAMRFGAPMPPFIQEALALAPAENFHFGLRSST
jgi:hypothetical protein